LTELVVHATLVEMYLRTTKRRNKDGTCVEYYHLAHNERHPTTKAPTPKIIHNFGRGDEVNREELSRLCRSIARVCGLVVAEPSEQERPSVAEGSRLPADVKLIGSVELGAVLVAEALWNRLDLGPLLRTIAKARSLKVPYERALFAMTVNRLCEPESKLGVWDRWLKEVYLPSCDGLKLDNMYEAMDLLHENIEAVEHQVFATTANLFNLDVDVVFYDTTTAAFAIDEEDEDSEDGVGFRKLGHSKLGTWTPQVVVALAVTREGFPVRSWVFPGNTADVTTVEKVKADLKEWKLGRALFVADSGMNSEENRLELARACGKYLLAVRAGSVKEVREEVLSRRGPFTELKDNLHIKEVKVGDGVRARRYVLCYNPQEAAREKKHREKVVEELEKELAQHQDLSVTARWAIELKASRRYGRYLKVTEQGKLAIDRDAIREAGRLDGKWVLQTNDDTLTMDDAAHGYRALLVIERCFRSLKQTRIKMTPMWHWLPRRIEAHVKICVLALLLERVAEHACGRPWPRIRKDLKRLQATLFQSGRYRFYQRNELTTAVSSTLKALAVPVPNEVLAISPLG
jgi:hypothetical protein